MPIRIFNNISSLTTRRVFDENNDRVGNSVIRIGSGLRISQASDDGGSFSLSENLRSETRVLKQAGKNTNSAVSLLNVAEAALSEVSTVLIRLREMASQASSGTVSNHQRAIFQMEVNILKEEIDHIANITEFSGEKILDGSYAKGATNPVIIALGKDSSSSNTLNLKELIDLKAVTTEKLGINSISVSSQSDALLALRDINGANESLLEIRNRVGTTQKRLLRIVSSLNINVQNLASANSIVKDADLGLEFAELTRNQILVQSSASMVGQSNLIPRAVLQLLQ